MSRHKTNDQSPENQPAQTVLKVGSDYYVLASTLASRRITRVLADGHSFAVFDAAGDIVDSPLEPLGFFSRDTRHLSRFELTVAGQVPYFLNCGLSDDRAQFRATLTNGDLTARGSSINLARDSIQLERGWVLAGQSLFHRLMLRNYAGSPIEIELEFFFNVDFADVFEVRGVTRDHRGQLLEPVINRNSVQLCYLGLDQQERSTELRFSCAPDVLNHSHAIFGLTLQPEQGQTIVCQVTPATAPNGRRASSRPVSRSFDSALEERQAELARSRMAWTQVRASRGPLDSLINEAIVDLSSITTDEGEGTFMMAGIPWFATLFGRDSIITALSVLPFNPEIAIRTLRTLARYQGAVANADRDEQPGKIVHEIRHGEMAATGEIPFGRYYGSVDSTPLFLWLYSRCISVTGDLGLAAELWPAAERALAWIEQWGDLDGDGYVEYRSETARGLVNQGWKDSFDAISHQDGELARPPIALAEVQGYVYAGLTGVAQVAARLQKSAFASRLADRADQLKRSFLRDFWLDREGIIAIALDADKKPCRVMSSNAAHCLATGIVDGDHAVAVSSRLLADDMYSGWGIRTLSRNERRYNPLSYHNGSVWPHDNGIAALGLARTGNHAGVLSVLKGLVDAGALLHLSSLPELFCGLPREPNLGPVPYPVACYPQAWSAASIFMILQSMLGLNVLGFERRIGFDAPLLPDWLDWLSFDDLKVGDGSVSFVIRRAPAGSAIEIKKRSAGVRVEQ